MWILAGAILGLILAVVAFLVLQKSSFEVERSLEIDAPPAAVFAAIVDLKSWPNWNPSLMHEPDARLDYSDDYHSEGGYYSWDGKLVGAGKLTHLQIQPETSIRQQIQFLRPFKALNQVDWVFENNNNSTLVRWHMNGHMPFLLRFLNKRMEAAMGRDFELGLAMLNGYLNASAPHPVMSFSGTEALQDFSYWAIPFSGNLRQLEAARRSSIETLRAAAGSHVGLALTLYHHFDSRAASYEAEIAIPAVGEKPVSAYRKCDFTGGRYCKMTLRGDLKFIPLGWHALNSHCYMQKIKLDASRAALETYQYDPADIKDSNQSITTLYLPIKEH